MALLTASSTRMRTGRRQRTPARLSSLVCVLLLFGGLNASAQTEPSREYQIKAVFLFNFAQFVEWPSAAFAGANSPLIIGILGDDPFGAYLDETVKNERVNNRPLEIHRYRRVDDVKACHILFISPSPAETYEQIFDKLRGRSILTVGDVDGFATRGMIRFLTEQNRVRMRVNLAAARAAGLTISSKVLRAAEIVGAERSR